MPHRCAGCRTIMESGPITCQKCLDLAAELEAERFSPVGDNHHNAALCPHCGAPLRKALGRIKELEAELENANADRDEWERERTCLIRTL